MMIAMADVFDDCFEKWKAEELVKFMELFLVVPMQEVTTSDNTDREITPLSSSTRYKLMESRNFLLYLVEKTREEYPDETAALSMDEILRLGAVKYMEKKSSNRYHFDDLSEAMTSVRTMSRAFLKAAQWASKVIFHLTHALVFGSIILLAALTVGSLTLSLWIMSIGGQLVLSVSFMMYLMISPFFVSFLPAIATLVALLVLAALSSVIFGSVCFGLSSLLCWSRDYMLGHDTPGARKFAALLGRARALLANGLLRLREFARIVVGCCRYIKHIVSLIPVRLMLLTKSRIPLMPITRSEPSKTL
ncbi:hypothetical protein MPTK1_2g20060 [Marchantia polymorpha subsp. ruderalis]